MKKTDKNVASVTPMRLVAERIINHDNNKAYKTFLPGDGRAILYKHTL